MPPLALRAIHNNNWDLHVMTGVTQRLPLSESDGYAVSDAARHVDWHCALACLEAVSPLTSAAVVKLLPARFHVGAHGIQPTSTPPPLMRLSDNVADITLGVFAAAPKTVGAISGPGFHRAA